MIAHPLLHHPMSALFTRDRARSRQAFAYWYQSEPHACRASVVVYPWSNLADHLACELVDQFARHPASSRL